ncbi:MAG: PmoA family protein [Thermoguttaceae bacterium]|nr:PmoA family protein [Thermoguttaceae bacterium]MDW8039156.1 DUF6807 family protein [Thermoguttaceae bacterium]
MSWRWKDARWLFVYYFLLGYPTLAAEQEPAKKLLPSTTDPSSASPAGGAPQTNLFPPSSTEESLLSGQLPEAKPVPAMQVLPLPYEQASFQYLGRELTRYHFGPSLRRPFLYPVAGPEGRSLTRMGHPRDPFGHSHHNSVWISHADVGGVNFWTDRQNTFAGQFDRFGRIVCQRIEQYEDGDRSAWLVAAHAWQTEAGKTLLLERRRIEVQLIDPQNWWILIDMEMHTPAQEPVTIGQSPFGMIGVRMAKTIGVSDGGGRLLNSEGQLGEPAIFRKPARWVDYSGPILPIPHSAGSVAAQGPNFSSQATPSAPPGQPIGSFSEPGCICPPPAGLPGDRPKLPSGSAAQPSPTTSPGTPSSAASQNHTIDIAQYCAGITLMDHPANPTHPTPFHVRADGWMGVSLTLAGPITIQPAKPLRLRYGLWIHSGLPSRNHIDAQWQTFAKMPMPTFPPRKTP